MKVRDMMTKSPATTTPDATLEAVARLMRGADCGMIPVLGEDQMPIGAITDRDIVIRAIAEGVWGQAPVRDYASTPAITVTEETDLDECIEILEERQIRRVIVVDTSGRCVGVVAQADVAEHASKRKAAEMLQEVSKPASTPLSPRA